VRYITGLDLHNVVTFKKASVDFDKNLTYVRGLNLDSDPVAPTSNGAGKTLLFSALANVLYQTTPLALKKKAKKDILRQRGSSVGVVLRPTVDGPEYEIIQTSTSYKIYEDGKDLELRTIPLAEEFIRKLFPLSETKFYSTCYLSTQRPYPLQRDTDSNRLQHIADIFNLDLYDGIREVLAKQLRSIKDSEVKLSVLEQHLLELRKKIKGLSAPISSTEYKKAKTTFEQCAKKIEKLQSNIFDLSTRQRDLNALLNIEHELDDLRGRYPFKKKPGVMVRLLKTQRLACLQWDKWSGLNSHARAMYDRIETNLEQLEVPSIKKAVALLKRDKLGKRIKSYDSDIAELLAQKRAYDSANSILETLQTEYDELGVEGNLDVDYESDIAVLKATLKLEKLVHNHGDSSECPTCNSPLDMDAIRNAVTKAKKRLAKIETLSEASRLKKRIDSLHEQLPEFDADRLSELNHLRTSAHTKLESVSESLVALEKRASLIRQRNNIEFPEKPESEKPELTLSEIEESLDLCSSILESLTQKHTLLSNHADLSELRSEEAVVKALEILEADRATIEAEISKTRTMQSSCASLITDHEQYQNTHRVYTDELSDVETKIAKLAPGVSDKKILEILMKAYGTKGLRATAAASVCRLLQTNLNHYRDLIFAEPFSFEVIASESGVSILVDRNNGKPDSVSDVRNLSGAESNSFQLLSLMALLPLLPDADRVNLVVLDEPTSHMDVVSRSIFNERYVPVLREIVPAVYIISPHSDDLCTNSTEWIVQKQNGVSSLLTS